MPQAPLTLDETGLPADLVHQLIFKTLHLAGELKGSELSARLGVAFGVLSPFLDQMKRDRQCELSGGSVGPQSYVYRLTDSGHSRAVTYTEHNQYVGKLPVPIDQYARYMDAFRREAKAHISREAVRRAFADVVLSDKVLDQLGPAISSGHSLFIYGPPGNGKTLIAHTVGNLFPGHIAVPHAISVDTEVIRVYDVLTHQAIPPGEPTAGLELAELEDHRWVRCKRPVVTVGGELTLDSLELGYSSANGFYRAPLQTVANGGILVIDDFGRQRVAPRDILNRWIVPLESRFDHLVLQTGQKFELPFELLIVFATNLNPLDLLDESFLRRIRNKVYAESPTREQFVSIFERCCLERNLPFDRELVETLIRTELDPRMIQMRGCQPRDLIEHALSLASYTGQPRILNAELMSAACATYFLNDEETS